MTTKDAQTNNATKAVGELFVLVLLFAVFGFLVHSCNDKPKASTTQTYERM